jgi:hypothetical protein
LLEELVITAVIPDDDSVKTVPLSDRHPLGMLFGCCVAARFRLLCLFCRRRLYRYIRENGRRLRNRKRIGFTLVLEGGYPRCFCRRLRLGFGGPGGSV